MVFRFRARSYVYLLPKQLDEQVVKLHFRAFWEHKFMALVRAQVKALDLSTVPFGACGSYAFLATGNLDYPQRVFEFCIPVEGSMDVRFLVFQQQWVSSSCRMMVLE